MSVIQKRQHTDKAGKTRTQYVLRWYDPETKERRSKSFKSRTDANAFQSQLDGTIKAEKQGRDALHSEVFKDAAEAYCAKLRTGYNGAHPLEANTVANYERQMAYVYPFLGTLRVGEITYDILCDMRDRMLADERFSRNMVEKTIKMLRTFFNRMIDEKVIQSNPAARVIVANKTGRHDDTAVTRKDIHSKADVKAILELAEVWSNDTSPGMSKRLRAWKRYKVILHLMFYCGMRESECAGLARMDVNFDTGTITVSQRADMVSRKIGTVKSKAARRVVTLPDHLIGMLRDHLRSHNHELVFATETGKPWIKTNFRARCWDLVQEQAGVTYRNLHAARHFFASLMIENGADARTLSELIGHADPAFTIRVYTHLLAEARSNDHRRKMANAIVLT